MKRFALLPLWLCMLTAQAAIICPSLEFVKSAQYNDIVPIQNGRFNAAIDFAGKTDEHQIHWQMIIAPLFGSDLSESQYALSVISNKTNNEAEHTFRRGREVDECTYLSSRTFHQLHAFHCEDGPCFK